MARSLLIFDARANVAPASNAARLALVNVRPVLEFKDAATNEVAIFEAIMPQAYGGRTLTAKLFYFMASAVSGDIDWDVEVEAISPGDSLDLDAADSFDTVNSTDNTTVPGTAGFLDLVIVTLTNKDSVVAGDHVRFRVTRDGAADTASGDARLYKIEIREA
jgi:hypothetical protein